VIQEPGHRLDVEILDVEGVRLDALVSTPPPPPPRKVTAAAAVTAVPVMQLSFVGLESLLDP
jgi:hypothetical protein